MTQKRQGKKKHSSGKSFHTSATSEPEPIMNLMFIMKFFIVL